jgi:GT2 family glycosyltransferase
VDVSIIIVTRNTRSETVEAIDSILRSNDRLAKEIIVVDNGSTDDTAKFLAQRFPQVNYLPAGRNLGFARANNLGARDATGEFFLLLNSDARLQPDALSAAVSWVRAHPECGIVGAQLLNPDGSPQNSIANYPSLATELLNKSLLRRLFPARFPGKERPFSEPMAVESVVGAFMLIRKTLWDTLGGLDERYFFFLEETDFCFEAKARGALTFHLPQVEIWHGQGQTAKVTPSAARIEYWRSRYAYFKKRSSLPTRIVLRLGLCLRLIANWLASALLTLLTFGQARRWKQKLITHSSLLAWHCKGCPERAGLPR